MWCAVQAVQAVVVPPEEVLVPPVVWQYQQYRQCRETS